MLAHNEIHSCIYGMLEGLELLVLHHCGRFVGESEFGKLGEDLDIAAPWKMLGRGQHPAVMVAFHIDLNQPAQEIQIAAE